MSSRGASLVKRIISPSSGPGASSSGPATHLDAGAQMDARAVRILGE